MANIPNDDPLGIVYVNGLTMLLNAPVIPDYAGGAIPTENRGSVDYLIQVTAVSGANPQLDVYPTAERDTTRSDNAEIPVYNAPTGSHIHLTLQHLHYEIDVSGGPGFYWVRGVPAVGAGQRLEFELVVGTSITFSVWFQRRGVSSQAGNPYQLQ